MGGVILAVGGRFPTSLDRVVAQLEQVVGGVPGVVSEGPAIPRVVSLCEQRPVLGNANGTIDAGTGRAQACLEDAEQTERPSHHGIGQPRCPVKAPSEDDAHA